jgi:AAA+ superfamily predicted ATPase
MADATWLGWLLGRQVLDPSLGGCARLQRPAPVGIDELALDPEVRLRLRAVAANANSPSHLLLNGPHGAGKFALASAIAHDRGMRLLVVDARDWATPAEVRVQMQRSARAGRWFDAIVYLHGVAPLAQREPQLLRALMDGLPAAPVQFVLASVTPVPPVPGVVLDAVRIEVAYPSVAARKAAWRRALAARRLAAGSEAIERIANRFAIGPGQIEQAASDVAVGASVKAGAELSYAELACAARAQCGAQLAGLAQRIMPEASFEALVIPSEVRAQLREICNRVGTREAVRRDWAAGSVHAREIGITALFTGPSGTGKTLAAEAVARELGFDMYRIDLAAIVSKYIGETEKNLDRVFTAAEHANAVLFFDEADALFGKRSEVKDAHDRYANIEVAYLLQKMERFDGLAILASNLRQNIDEAFARRLTFTVNFPFPEQPQRRQLWEALWPPRAPRAADVDFDWLAREFRFSGGAIRNTVLAAAHLAAADRRIVTRAHLLHATRREFQKLGKNVAPPHRAESGPPP